MSPYIIAKELVPDVVVRGYAEYLDKARKDERRVRAQLYPRGASPAALADPDLLLANRGADSHAAARVEVDQ